jgi:hypothetical protein
MSAARLVLLATLAAALAGASCLDARGGGPSAESPAEPTASVLDDPGRLLDPELPRWSLQLPGGERVTFERERVERAGPEAFDWIGSVAGEPARRVVLSVRAGQLQGSFDFGGRAYEIRPAEGGRHVVVEIDRSRFREHLDDAAPPGKAPDQSSWWRPNHAVSVVG